MARDQVLSSIRNTLGCTCREDVLYAVTRETWKNPGFLGYTRVDIGR